MIGLGAAYALAGLVFAAFAVLTARDPTNPRRGRTAAFWALLALSFLAGGGIGDLWNGVLVLALVGLAASGLGRGRPATPAPRSASEPNSPRAGPVLFALALIVPAVALFGTLVLKTVQVGARPLIDPKQASVISLALGVVVALGVSGAVLRSSPLTPLREGRRLIEMVGWAAVLPQMLAALGTVFALAGVGHAVGEVVERWLPGDSPLGAVVVYTTGMALFTMVMGNGLAAFPVMTAGVGLPLIVRKFGGDPAIMSAIGMLSGFCGTLLTPMAANFNIVPVALLDLPDRWAVIRAQAPTALLLLLVNTGLMYALVYRF